MNKTEIYDLLNYVDHSREKRQEVALLVLNNFTLVDQLLNIAIIDNNPISCRACWVLEFIAKENISFIFPFLDTFTLKLGKVGLESSIRTIAKICEYLTTNYFSNTRNSVQDVLTEVHLERITTACFDWLIGFHKVAAKAYAMRSLCFMGSKFDWILPELIINPRTKLCLGKCSL